MIDHVGIPVTDMNRSKEFYQKMLKGIGYEMLMDLGAEVTGSVAAAGFGVNDKPDFWISESGSPPARNHVAFSVKDRETVDAFHKAGLEAGGTDNGAPGLRPQYHPNYYGAFILDPDGHNIEAVFHG